MSRIILHKGRDNDNYEPTQHVRWLRKKRMVTGDSKNGLALVTEEQHLVLQQKWVDRTQPNNTQWRIVPIVEEVDR